MNNEKLNQYIDELNERKNKNGKLSVMAKGNEGYVLIKDSEELIKINDLEALKETLRRR